MSEDKDERREEETPFEAWLDQVNEERRRLHEEAIERIGWNGGLDS